MSAKRGNSFYI